MNTAFATRSTTKATDQTVGDLTASYSVDGYAAHGPLERDDRGVISPTAALSSIVYTPDQSLQVMHHLYEMGDKVFGPYGFYDAFSETADWYPKRYLAIDQGPIAVMIENYRTGLLWELLHEPSRCTKRTKETGIQCKEINDKINTYRFMHSSPLLE